MMVHMSGLSYKDFMDEVRSRIKDFSQEDFRNMVLHWAENELPAGRIIFLDKLTPVIDVGLEADLIDEITAFAVRVQRGDYCDGWGWDDDIQYERDWGDESWADEMDDYFLRAGYRLVKGNPHTARQAYEKLLDILEMGQEPGHLPGDPDCSTMLQVDVHEQIALLFRAVYLTSLPEERPDKVYDLMMKYGSLFGSVGMRDIIEIREEPLPDFGGFLAEWIEFLLRQDPDTTVSGLLREAILLKGGTVAISEFARQYPKEHPKAYIDWLSILNQQDSEVILQVAREGLVRIPMNSPVRADVAEFIAGIGDKNNDERLRLEGYWECFYAKPAISYLFNLYLAAMACDCFEDTRGMAEQRVMELHDEGIVNRKPYFHFPDGVVYITLLFGGNYQQVYEMCSGQGSLGWSCGINPKPLFIAYMMMFLAGEGSPAIVLNRLWDDVIRSVSSGLAREDYEKSRKILGVARGLTPLDREQEEFYFDYCIDEVGQRVEAIVSGKYRGSYGKAASLLVAMAETLTSRQQRERALTLVEVYGQKFYRYSAFKRELAISLKESRLL